MKSFYLVISCEHAVNTIPETYKAYFEPHIDLLKTHQAYDIGAFGIAKTLSQQLNSLVFQAHTSRLLIDYNRSLTHRACFSFITKALAKSTQQHIIQDYYHPYRNKIINHMKTLIQQHHTILHFSIHTFTPTFNHTTRKGDLCLLYDPARKTELALAKKWHTWLRTNAPDLYIRRNYPYVGKSDGLVSFCRTQFSNKHYIGFEIESNQAMVTDPANQIKFGQLLAEMLKQTFP